MATRPGEAISALEPIGETDGKFAGHPGALASLGVPVDGSAPTVSGFIPADAGSLANDDSVQFDVTNSAVDPVSLVVISVEFANGVIETIYDGTDFSDGYSGTDSSITDGFRYSFTREAFWPSSTLVFHIEAVGQRGAITHSTSYNLTVTDPVPVPLYFKMRGMDQTTSGLYDTWVVYGLPDFAAAQYTGSLNLPLRDVIIDSSWAA